METFISESFRIGPSGWFILGCICFGGCWLIHTAFDSVLTAILCAPLLVLGAAAGNNTFKTFAIELSSDKMVGMGMGFGAGMFAAGALIILVCWGISAIKN